MIEQALLYLALVVLVAIAFDVLLIAYVVWEYRCARRDRERRQVAAPRKPSKHYGALGGVPRNSEPSDRRAGA